MPNNREAPAVASLRAMAKQARGGGFLSGDDRQAAAAKLELQADAVQELIESCRPAAGPEGWGLEEYRRFERAFAAVLK
jgi:hypothetical protein